MKKQLLIVAIAATMATAATANVSFTGKYMGDYTDITGNSNYTQKIDLSLKGTAGSSVVVVNMDLDTKTADAGTGQTAAGNVITVNETYIKTKVMGVSVKAGNMKGLTGNGLSHKKSSAKGKVKLSAKVAGIKAVVTSADNGTNLGSNLTLDLSGKVAGTKILVQDVLNSDTRTISVAGEAAGVKALAEKNDAFTSYQLSTQMNGVELTYVNITADSASKVTQDDGIFGNISATSKDVSGIVLATSTPLGKVTFKNYTSTNDLDVDMTTNKVTLSNGGIAYSLTKKDTSDMELSAKIKLSF